MYIYIIMSDVYSPERFWRLGSHGLIGPLLVDGAIPISSTDPLDEMEVVERGGRQPNGLDRH